MTRPFLPGLAYRVIVAATLLSGCVPDAGREARLDADFLRLLAAEDARPTSGRDLNVLIEATRNDRVFLRSTAVRALGRLENPALLPYIESLLDDAAPLVRQTAANAAAQAVRTSDGNQVFHTLLGRVEAERDAEVLGTLARSMGRLSMDVTNRRLAYAALAEISIVPDQDAPTPVLTGVVLGWEALVRGGGDAGIGPRVAARLTDLTRYVGSGAGDASAARVRALAVSTLGQARRIAIGHVRAGLSDEDPEVRMMAARFIDAVPPAQRPELLRRALADRSARSGIEAIGHIAALPRDDRYCSYLEAATAPALFSGLRAVALDALARPCPDVEGQRDLLRRIAGENPVAPGAWQPASHALLSLSQISPDMATALLPDHVGHDNPFVRTYAARVARVLGNRSVLATLAEDPDGNVRTAAIEGLFALEGHRADGVLVDQLERDDPQLLLAAAGLLEGTADRESGASAVLEAFERISAAQRETWRDPRRALLERLADLGGAHFTDRLTPYLSDYDPVVAQEVAEVLQEWNGRSYIALALTLPPQPLPSVTELRAMSGSAVVLYMEGGGTIEIELHPYLSTTNTFRFVRLVNAGTFDGLTFHRWAPNFVIQGGSPGATEYQGDGPFTRDEVGLLPHWRGTVGISTRGHDTGDGQIFVNLMDNVRLDHLFSIVGTVTSGMDVVDQVTEGSVIERAEVGAARRPSDGQTPDPRG